jgi:hypothetical protein
MTADSRAQWAELLHAPVDAAPEVAAAAFLRALPDDNFLPPAERVAAANALVGTAAPTGRDDVEQLLRDEVEAFATKYWTLTPADRLTAWADLSRRGADAARLRELEPGLDVTASPLADPAAEELATLVRALFVLPPRVRAIRRNTWLLEHAPTAEKWRAAYATFRSNAPALAALEPQLRATLAPEFQSALAAFVEGGTARPTSAAPVGSAGMNAPRPVLAAEPVTPRPTGEGWKGGSVIGGGTLFVLFIIIKVLSLLARSDAPPSRTPAPQLPNYSAQTYTPQSQMPNYPAPDYTPPTITAPLPAMPTFTPAQVAEFEKYEQEKAAGNDPPVPLAYAGWRLAGRPRGIPAAVKPAVPDKNSIYLDGLQILVCQNYDRRMSGRIPMNYAAWVAAGKPSAAGYVPLPTPDP